MAHSTTQKTLTKREAVWICRRMIKIWHKDLRGDAPGKQLYWRFFLDTLRQCGRISDEDYATWQCPFK